MAKLRTDILNFEFFANGVCTAAEGQAAFESVNPSTGEVLARVADASPEDMRKTIGAARQAFRDGRWSGLTVKARGKYLRKIAEIIRENAKELAELESLDTGKTGKQTTFIDVPTCADTFDYFGAIGDPLKSTVNAVAAPVKSVTEREPLGVVGCIIPWNYPLIMAAWKCAPALIAGNTVILKPSSQASVSLLKLGELMAEAGLPKGVFNIVSTARHETVTELIQSPDVAMISFTGGTDTGREVMRLASGTVKKVALELGGKSAAVVFADCDFEAATGGVLSSIFMNQGQMCTAMSRLYIQDKIYDRFLNALVERTKTLKIGNSMDAETEFGPLVSRAHRDRVLRFIETGKKEGARLLCGGKIPAGNDLKGGFYLEPAIFADVTGTMTIARDEIFGPVLSVFKFSTEHEPIAMANDSPYGLASCIWTKDLKKAERVARKLESGIVWINTYGGFYNEAPFGGYKQSGSGRELGLEGLFEFTQTKHICTDQTPGGKPLVAAWF